MDLIRNILVSSWDLLVDASPYVLFGLLISGMLKVLLDPDLVARHLGNGRFSSVFKAALLGIPIPLCSCGVLPAALSLKKQGANNGATAAFMISTPESGVDSIAVTYALIDPIMAVARPVVAFFTAALAGIIENLIAYRTSGPLLVPTPGGGTIGNCQDILQPPPHQRIGKKAATVLRFAFVEFWADIAGWFLFGILLAGIITTVIPEDIFSSYLGTGLPSMLLMLVIGIPIYICASASTPVAAALILKGISPGAALVFLLAGPATNVTSLTVLFGILGKRTAAIYLSAIAICAVGFGLLLDHVYAALGIGAVAVVKQSSELLPEWLRIAAVAILLIISIKPVSATLLRKAHTLIGRQKRISNQPLSYGST
jgi:uncharacterized membrane protein YraQ (UPF0718 family)